MNEDPSQHPESTGIPDIRQGTLVNPQRYFLEADRGFLERLPTICNSLNFLPQTKPTGGSNVVAYWTRYSPDFQEIADYGTLDRSDPMTSDTFPEQRDAPLNGPVIIRLPDDELEVRIISPETATVIPIGLTTQSTLPYDMSDLGRPSASVTPFPVGPRLSDLRDNVLDNRRSLLTADERDAYDKAIEDNQLPRGFELNYRELAEGEIVLAPEYVNYFLSMVVNQHPAAEHSQILCVTRGETKLILVPTYRTKNQTLLALNEGGPKFLLDILNEAFDLAKGYIGLDTTNKISLHALNTLAKMFAFDVLLQKDDTSEFELVSNGGENQLQIGQTKEQTIANEVRATLEARGVPQNTLIMGSLVNFLGEIGIGLQDKNLNVLYNLAELRAILQTLGEYGLSFTEATIPVPPILGSKIAPAVVSDNLRLPHPQTWASLDGQSPICINDGIVPIEGKTGRGVVKAEMSSGGMSVRFVEKFDPHNWKPDPSGDTQIYVEEIAHQDPKGRSRDTRAVFMPGTKQPIVVIDRLSQPQSRVSNVAQGATWESSSLDTPRYREQLAQLLQGFHDGLTNHALSLVYGPENLDRILAAYPDNLPAQLGLFGYDLIFPNAEYPSSRSQGGFPFINEIHNRFQLPQNLLDKIAQALASQARQNGKVGIIVLSSASMGLNEVLDPKHNKSLPTFLMDHTTGTYVSRRTNSASYSQALDRLKREKRQITYSVNSMFNPKKK